MTAPSFAYRGVVEGFYGPPYSHANRRWLIERLGRWDMNVYVYAPKDDALGRAEWRSRYSPETLSEFAELVELGLENGVAVGFAISPGLSIQYSSAADLVALQRKLRDFADLGARFFCLALDDVSSEFTHAADRSAFDSLAQAHVGLAHATRDLLPADSRLWLIPTHYAGVASSAYLEELGRTLDEDIEVGWTGRTIVSPTIDASEARARAEQLGRRLLVWDNTPVSDGPMRPMLHLGPYVGRHPELPAHLSGVLLNPMELCRASTVTLQTAAAYLRDPAGYDPEAAWNQALAEIGRGAGSALATFAAAHRFSALSPHDRDPELERSFDQLRDCAPAAQDGALGALAQLLEARIDAADRLRAGLEDRHLAAELEPWLFSHQTETQRMAAAADLLDALRDDSDAITRLLAFIRFEGRLTRLETPRVSSYGPRRVLYPQLGAQRDDDACFGSDPALFVDRCLSDEMVRFAESAGLADLSPLPAKGLHGPNPE